MHRFHRASRRVRTARDRRALAALAAAWLLLASPASGADPQGDAPPPPAPTEAEPDLTQPLGPTDPYHRGTPRSTAMGFILAAREADWERAAAYLDLRRLPPAERAQGPELARQLKEVLDQTAWLDFENYSATPEGAPEDGLPPGRDRLARIESPAGPVDLFLERVPRVDDDVPIWKVAAGTVALIPELYDEIGPSWIERQLPEVLVDRQFLELRLWQWIALALAGLGAFLASLVLTAVVIRLLHALASRSTTDLDDRMIRLFREPVRLAIAVGVFEALHARIGLSVPARGFLHDVEQVILIFAAGWALFRVVDLIVLALRQGMERRGQLTALPALPPTRRIAKGIVLALALLAILASLGVNVTAALAGLGVGGLAVALAAQKTFENLFGGVTLFADQPVRVGDFCRYGDAVGTVEEIGLRSTRIRSLDRTLISVPNADFSQLQLENFAKRDRILLKTVLGLRYETTPEQLRFILARLRELLISHPRVTADPARVRFVGFGAYSLDVEVFAYVDTSDWNEYLEIREDLYLQMMDVVAEGGSGFAFPSQTTYLGRDEGLDEERSRAAAERVRQWRETGELPFPRTPERRRREIENTLAWPPEGSGDAPTPGASARGATRDD